MKPRVESRSTEIDNEVCVDWAGGRYDLVIAATQHLRELRRKARETTAYITPIDALLEIQTGKANLIDCLGKVR